MRFFFFFPHTRRCKREKIRENPLSALTRENKREREREGMEKLRASAAQIEKLMSDAAILLHLYNTEHRLCTGL